MVILPRFPLESSNLLYVVKSIVNPSAERAWDKWHSDSHVPDVLKQPGFLKATKLRRSDSPSSDPEYWTIYEMTSLEAFQRYNNSDAARTLREDHKERFGSSTKLERFVLVKTFEATSRQSETKATAHK